MLTLLCSMESAQHVSFTNAILHIKSDSPINMEQSPSIQNSRPRTQPTYQPQLEPLRLHSLQRHRKSSSRRRSQRRRLSRSDLTSRHSQTNSTRFLRLRSSKHMSSSLLPPFNKSADSILSIWTSAQNDWTNRI